METFTSLYSHDFVRIASCVPRTKVADVPANLAETIRLAKAGSAAGAAIMVFPELGLSSYAIEDLLFQDALLAAVEAAIDELVNVSRDLYPVLIVGAPLRYAGGLFNTAVVIRSGLGARRRAEDVSAELPRILRETAFHLRRRHLRAANQDRRPSGAVRRRPSVSIDRIGRCHVSCRAVRGFLGAAAAFDRGGAGRCRGPDQSVGEQYHDRQGRHAASALRQPIRPRDRGLCLLRRGPGESTTDLAWDGHAAIFEYGELLAETERFAKNSTLVTADVDLGRIRQERMRFNTFGDCAREESAANGRVPHRIISTRCAG